MRTVGLDPWADRYGFITVYPDAVGGAARHTWALGCFQCTWADVQGIDDYCFIRELLAALSQKYSIISSRVFVTGVSLGGSFAFDFACRSSNLIAGAAIVASLPSPDELPGCQNGPPVSVLIMNGDQDPNIPWDGGGQYNYLSNSEAAHFWAVRATLVSRQQVHARCLIKTVTGLSSASAHTRIARTAPMSLRIASKEVDTPGQLVISMVLRRSPIGSLLRDKDREIAI